MNGMDPMAALRRLIRRQAIRAHIRREQEEFLQEHPELRLPSKRPAEPARDAPDD